MKKPKNQFISYIMKKWTLYQCDEIIHNDFYALSKKGRQKLFAMFLYEEQSKSLIGKIHCL
jgi:hypothetical protein